MWDREIIQTALADFYEKDMDAFRKQLEHNITKASEGREPQVSRRDYLIILRSSKQRNMALPLL